VLAARPGEDGALSLLGLKAEASRAFPVNATFLNISSAPEAVPHRSRTAAVYRIFLAGLDELLERHRHGSSAPDPVE
jgi:hypothetical protein